MTVADDLATVERELRNYHDLGCFVYLPSGACDCGVEPPVEALAAHKRVEAEIARLEAAVGGIGSNSIRNLGAMKRWRERAEAAEAELRYIRSLTPDGSARAVRIDALLAEDGAVADGVLPSGRHVSVFDAEDGAADNERLKRDVGRWTDEAQRGGAA